MMNDLSRKLKEEAADDACIISCRFPLDETLYEPTKFIEDGPNPLWVYEPKSQ